MFVVVLMKVMEFELIDMMVKVWWFGEKFSLCISIWFL